MPKIGFKFPALILPFLCVWAGYAACGATEPTASENAQEKNNFSDFTPDFQNPASDATAPETLLGGGPASQTTDTFATFFFRANETDCSFECSLDDGDFTSCSNAYTVDGIEFGEHVLEVRAIDTAGNRDQTPVEYRWEVILLPPLQDVQAPETVISSGPANTVTSMTAAFGFQANENSTFECRLDSGSYTACTSPYLLNSMALGNHSFEVRATDVAGNTDATPAVYDWQVVLPPDTHAPETTVLSQPASPTTNTNAEFTFQANESSTFECNLDGTGYASCASPHAIQNVSVGTHVFEVRAVDVAGNSDASPASATWEVLPPPDTQDPLTVIDSGPANPTTGTSAEFSFSSNEAGGSFECSLDGEAFAACTSPRQYSNLSSGTHAFEVRSMDAAGNTDGSPASHSWEIQTPPDTQAPSTSITSAPLNGQSSGQNSVFEFSADEASSFQCSLDGASLTACASPATYGGLAVGTHQFEVRATDGAGNADPTPATYSWQIVAADPLASLSDDFESGSLNASWQSLPLTNGNAYSAYGFQNGSLYMDPPNNTPWFNNFTSSYFYKLASGDFKITTRVHVQFGSNGTIDDAYQLAGLMLRSPNSGQTPNSQNTVHIALGDAVPNLADRIQIETKTTRNSVSPFATYNYPWLMANGAEVSEAELRICRVGTRFYMYGRAIGQTTWTEIVIYTANNSNLGSESTLQAGLISYANRAPNMRGTFDFINFATVTDLAECTQD